MTKNAVWAPGLAVLLAFVHGMLYVFLIPPWQHYDEPSHFEYVWLLASTGKPPQTHTPDLSFRRKLVQSMAANDFFRGVPVPALDQVEAGEQTYGLVYSQLDESPLFYWFAAIPVRFLQNFNPAVMLAGGRMASVGFFMFTVLAIWGVTREITPPGSILRGWVPLAATLLPGFVDLMTAVNNDVGAVAAFTFFLWGSLYFLNKPYSPVAAIWVLVSMLICIEMKSTSYLAAPLSLLVFLFGWIQGKAARWIGFGLVVSGLMGLSFVLTWKDAAYWHRATSQPLPTRVKLENAPVGLYALQLDPSAPTTPTLIRPLQQPLPSPSQNSTLTFGVWMWISNLSATPLETRTPVLSTGKEDFFETVAVDTTPRFFAFQVNIPSESGRFWISLSPTIQNGHTVYYDGFVLAEGQYPLDESPVFDGANGTTGTWGGQFFANLIRNPSAESVWPALQPTIDNQLSRFIPNHARISTLLFGLFDWTMTASYFRATANNLLETFWGRFGWGHVPIPLPGVYAILGILTVMGLTGFGVTLISPKMLKDRKWIVLVLAFCLIWGAALLRGEIFIFYPKIFIPGARYAYPAMAPTLLGLFVGWQAWGGFFRKSIPVSPVDLRRFAHIILALLFLSLDLVSISSILRYYHSSG